MVEFTQNTSNYKNLLWHFVPLAVEALIFGFFVVVVDGETL